MEFSRLRLACVLLLLLLPVSLLAQNPPPLPDTPYFQDVHEAYPLATAAENDVRALTFDASGRLWAATGAGVRYLDGKTWKAPDGGDKLGPTHALYQDTQGTLWVGAWNGLYRATPEKVVSAGVTEAPVSAIRGFRASADKPETLFVVTPQALLRGVGGQWTPIKRRWHTVVRAILPTAENRVWLATQSGLYLHEQKGENATVTRYGRPNVLLSSNVYALVALPDGTVAIGSTGGIDFYQGRKRVRSLGVKDGLPNRHARSIARDDDGRLWVATRLGTARYTPFSSPAIRKEEAIVAREVNAGRPGMWNLRHSRRWLLSDDARAVVIGKDGTAWVGTAAGVDAIRKRRITLEEKAAYFLELLRARHIRPPGLVGPAVLEKPGDLSRSFIEDDDNDGEHTGMYCAMESMRYAVTKDPQARENAKAAFHALMVLQQATGTPHFIARSVLPIGTAPLHEVDRIFTPEEIAEEQRADPRSKIIEKRWIPTADGKWLWKRDASSDEIDGHLFGYALYFDLAADAAEKKLVADQVDRIVGGIVDNGYILQDIDGKATQWGNWSPESLNHDPNWNEERCGNSVEIITHLGVAYHITGKAKYREAAQYLMEKHGYEKNMLAINFDTRSERTHINDELLSMVYPNLLTHPVFPTLTASAQTSLQRWHRTCRRDHIPFYDFVYNRYSGKTLPLDGAIETLREWPLDMIEWTVDSRQREDVQIETLPGTDEGMLTRLLPRSEMGLCMWDQEPYKVAIGRNGDREDKPTDWLLAYWMGRYYGLLAAPGR